MRRRKSESKIIKIQEEARWQPADDLKLKTALEQVNDINLVHQAITFSSYFTSNELESRWNELLFNKRKSSESNPSTKVRCVFPIYCSIRNLSQMTSRKTHSTLFYLSLWFRNIAFFTIRNIITSKRPKN